MAISDILATIDQEIAQLQQARALLSGDAVAAPKKRVGRPKKAAAVAVAAKKARSCGKARKGCQEEEEEKPFARGAEADRRSRQKALGGTEDRRSQVTCQQKKNRAELRGPN